MSIFTHKALRRAVPLATGGVMAASLLVNAAPAPAQTPKPHWGLYQWSGGAEKADIRGFWVFDRTGDQRMHDIIRVAASAWNSARDKKPELPVVAVHQDDQNVGKCFVNRTPGWSVASACTMPQNIEGVKGLVSRNADDKGHLTGAAFALSEGLTTEDLFSITCHTFGHIMGLENSEAVGSCMNHSYDPTKFNWYDTADGNAVLDLYKHSETAVPTTTSTPTTAAGATSTTAGGGGGATTTKAAGGGGATTTTAAGGATSTSTSTSTTAPAGGGGGSPQPTLPGGTTIPITVP